jgi:hypothetical protein
VSPAEKAQQHSASAITIPITVAIGVRRPGADPCCGRSRVAESVGLSDGPNVSGP